MGEVAVNESESSEGELILYRTSSGVTKIEVLYESETFWLNQKKIAELFGVDLRTVNEHLQNIFADGCQAARQSRTWPRR